MNRRAALKHTASLLGVSVLGAEAFLSGFVPKGTQTGFLSKKDIRLLDEIGETILPESDRSPGAKAARIGAFMNTIVTDCYTEADQQVFKSGLETIQQAARAKYGRFFLKLSPTERFELLSEFDQKAAAAAAGEPAQTHFFAMLKQLTIWGYFSSAPGVTQALRYDPVPGGYDGCVAYREGDRAWHGWLSSIG